MGKKRVIKQTEEEALKETEKRGETEKKAIAKAEKKAGKAKRLDSGRIFIQSSYNNTVITLADDKGNVVAWSSAGALGFKGPRKATPYAATRVVEALLGKAKNLGLKEVAVFVKGVGSGRDAAIRALANFGLEIAYIKDITPIPHNGCRPPKPRRV
jgi:small subunit ribosomal protein S11